MLCRKIKPSIWDVKYFPHAFLWYVVRISDKWLGPIAVGPGNWKGLMTLSKMLEWLDLRE